MAILRYSNVFEMLLNLSLLSNFESFEISSFHLSGWYFLASRWYALLTSLKLDVRFKFKILKKFFKLGLYVWKEEGEGGGEGGTYSEVRGVFLFEEVKGKGELGESGLLPSHSVVGKIIRT